LWSSATPPPPAGSPTVSSADLSGHGAGSELHNVTAAAALQRLVRYNRRLKTLRIHHSGFGLATFSAVLDEWERSNLVLQKLELFSTDPTSLGDEAQSLLEKEGVPSPQFRQTMELAAKCRALGRRNSVIARAMQRAGVAAPMVEAETILSGVPPPAVPRATGDCAKTLEAAASVPLTTERL